MLTNWRAPIMSGCGLVMSGQIVVGGDGCGCSGASTSGPQKLQPLELGCANASYSAVQSTDCAVSIQSTSAFIPLPMGDLNSTEFLMVQAKGSGTLRWGGDVGRLNGGQILGSVTFTGGEVFAFTVDSLAVSVTFTAGSKTLAQIINFINAEAVGLGSLTLPASLDPINSRILLTGAEKNPTLGIVVTAALALVGFPSQVSGLGVAPAETAISGLFLNQWPRGAGVSNIEIKGSLDVVVLAAGE